MCTVPTAGAAALMLLTILRCRQQQLGGRPMVLVGTSLGGTIAADYALAYPQVKGVGQVDSDLVGRIVAV